MNISKKVPLIVSIVLVLIWGFLGFRSAMHMDARTASPQFTRQVTLAEDVSVFNTYGVVDSILNGEPYDDDLTVLPAGSTGQVMVSYSRRHDYIKDPETEVYGFAVYFSQNDEPVRVGVQTGPETQLENTDIYYKCIENYEDIFAEYNQKVKEAKSEWAVQCILRVLTGIAVAAFFSAIFLIECIVANKLKMHPVVFGLICFVLFVIMLFAVLLSYIL